MESTVERVNTESDSEKNTGQTIRDPVKELVKSTKEKIQQSITSRNSVFDKNLIKKLVSKKKLRFVYEGFDLDLTYVTENIIAMGYPSNSIEKLYRNALTEVKRFFDTRHDKQYKVYNLCSERNYAENTFYQQAYFPFDDHEAPNINIMIPFCQDVHKWLTADSKNIAAIHCKAGKGRTGTMICSYLLYSGIFKTAQESLQFYGLMRTSNGKGVTIPSQIRYVYYMEEILNSHIPHPIKAPLIFLTKIKIYTVPFNKCYPFFKIDNEEIHYNYRKQNKVEIFKNEAYIELPVNNLSVCGDIRIEFYNKKTIGKDKLFCLWFNSFFAPKSGVLVVNKSMLDKALKDRKHKLFDANLKIEIQYIFDKNIKLNL